MAGLASTVALGAGSGQGIRADSIGVTSAPAAAWSADRQIPHRAA
jgi:hypothetical protein